MVSSRPYRQTKRRNILISDRIKYAISISIILLAILASICCEMVIAEEVISLKEKEKIINTAKEIAEKEKMDIKDCNIEVIIKGELVTVEISPKAKLILGGGGRIVFKKNGNDYKLIKVKHWQ